MKTNHNCIQLVLCLFLGFFGAHKFYLGNWKLGLIYIFTLGFILIGVCVDIFLIFYFWKEEEEEFTITSELKTKKGNLNKEKLELYKTANDSIINYKYTNNKGKTVCAISSGLCLWTFLVLLTISIVLFFVPFISNQYYKKDYATGKIENEYRDINSITKLIEREISVDYRSKIINFNKIKMFYPDDIATRNYPIILFSNPLGVPYKRYEAVFRHLASYGYIVVGNDDMDTDEYTLVHVIDELNKLNVNDPVFKNRLNLNEIGLAGFFQGTLPTKRVFNELPYSITVKTVYLLCLKKYVLEEKVLLDLFNNMTQSLFITGPEKGGSEYKNIMVKLNKRLTNDRVFALRKDVAEGDIVIYTDAYMTAWFEYTMKRNETLRDVFEKNKGEIYNNPQWTVIQNNNNLDYDLF